MPFGNTSSSTPVSGSDHRFTSVVVYFVPVAFGGVAVRVGVEVGFGIGACFFRCLGAGVVFGLGAAVDGVTFNGGRSASRLTWVSRDSCRDELAIDGSKVTWWSGSAAAEPVATRATAAPGIATFAMPGRITCGRG